MKINLAGKECSYIINNDTGSDYCVVLISGVSGRALSSRYDKLAKELNKNNISLARCDFWENKEDLISLSETQIHRMIDEFIEFLQNTNFKKFSLIGKSYGGKITLSHRNEKIKSMFLWAPAIDLNESSNLNELDIKIGVLQGTKDEIVSVENSKRLVEALPNAELIILEGADHSYKEEPYSTRLVEETVKFFKK